MASYTTTFKPHRTPPTSKARVGHGHWLIYVADNDSQSVLKYSCNDNDYWYELDKDDGRLYLYDVDLYIDKNSTADCRIIQIPIESFAGVSGGSLKINASLYNNNDSE
tara:strand:+ start:381 stop:704 length:324 start_codon:yes stop_codon:yes gene_type:complete